MKEIRVSREEFIRRYEEQLDILFNDERGDEKAHIYGYPITIHWNGIYCSCSDGATPSNYIIPAIKECIEELDEEDE